MSNALKSYINNRCPKAYRYTVLYIYCIIYICISNLLIAVVIQVEFVVVVVVVVVHSKEEEHHLSM